jgi:hypothetical protein
VFFTVIVYDLRLRSRSMDDNHDPRREAEEAMKFAIAAAGADRHRLIRLAIAWQELARAQPLVPRRRTEQAA